MFGHRLEDIRVKSGMTQKEFAKYLEIPLNTYTSWKLGLREPSMQAIISVCQRCNVSSDWLLGLKDGNTPSIIATHSAVSIHGNAIYNAGTQNRRTRKK